MILIGSERSDGRDGVAMPNEANKLGLDTRELRAFCVKHHIRKLSIFGSVLRGTAGPDSDVDILVEFAPGARIGLIHLARIERELAGKIGRKVDVRTSGDLSRYFRDEVVQSAELQYAEG